MRKKSFERRAVEQLSRSLAPNLHADTMWNAVAINLFNPQMSFQKSFEGFAS